MKRIIIISFSVLVFLALGSTLLLSESASLIGILMPVTCKDRKTGGGPEHTTACALKPECIENGFGLWTEQSFTPFDSRGNELALRYFKSTHREDHHQVRVTGDLDGSVLQVIELVPVEE